MRSPLFVDRKALLSSGNRRNQSHVPAAHQTWSELEAPAGSPARSCADDVETCHPSGEPARSVGDAFE